LLHIIPTPEAERRSCEKSTTIMPPPATRNLLRVSTLAIGVGTSYLIFKPYQTPSTTTMPAKEGNYAVAPNRSGKFPSLCENSAQSGPKELI